MITFFNFLKSDFIKIKKGPIIFIHFMMPIIGMILFFQCFSDRLPTPTSKVTGLFELSASVFPALTGIICAIVAGQEASAGRFQQMLTSHIRFMSFLSKLAVILILGFAAVLLLVCGSGVIFKYFLHQSPFGISYYLRAACILIIGNIFFYVLNLIISLRFGGIQSIVAGVLETIISPIFTSGLFDGNWSPLSPIISIILIIIIAYKWFSKWEGKK